MADHGFMFKKDVSVLNSGGNTHNEPISFGPPSARIELIQNGYKLHYEDMTFKADDLEGGISMIRSWMEEKEKQAAKADKK